MASLVIIETQISRLSVLAVVEASNRVQNFFIRVVMVG